ncbi:hypothetical protein LCGC14_0777710 [marine sediment metagenome]|uniref:Uncharacterized protein n=1 Tax=marine sediment metagenome TaxID=412755 RepID=A0A0F9QGB2_9ZZZZ
MASKPKHVGTVKIGSESYSLVQTDERQAWREEYLHEPPWTEGLPPMLSEPSETWHLGGLKSKQGIPGTSEYGQNTDARFPFRLLPGPEVTVLTLPTRLNDPVSIFEALDYIWVVAGTVISRIDPATDVVTESRDLGFEVIGVDGLKWEDDTGLVSTNAVDQSLWEVTAIGTPDTWAQAEAGVKPYRLASGIDRLFGIEDSGLLRNCVSGLDPMLAASWSDEIQCGEVSTLPTGLLAFEKTVLVGKPEGLFGVSPEGKGVPLIKRMIRDATNCQGMRMHEPYAMIPHSRGTYRFLPGLVESVGIEKELINESIIRGRFKDFSTDNQWLRGLLSVGTDTYIMVARDRTGGEPGFGPLVWDTWIYLSSKTSQTMHQSTLSSPPRLWFGHGRDVAYVKLSDAAGAPDVSDSAYRFATSGLRYTNKYTFGDWESKDFPKIKVVGRGTLSATRYWDVNYSVDGAAWAALDIDGNLMRVNSDGLHTFYLPLTAVGREIQFRLSFVGDSATAPPEISYFEPFAVPQSKKVPLNIVQLHLVADETEGERREARTAAQQLSDLHTLDESSSPLKASGPWGESKDMWLKSLSLISVIQEPDAEAEFLVEVALQERKVS